MQNDFGLPSNVVDSICRVFKSNPKILVAALYGSRAKGNFKNGSDIDLTLTAPELSFSELLKLENDLDDLLLPYQIDLSLLDKIESTDLLDHIARNGKVFYLNSSRTGMVLEKLTVADLQLLPIWNWREELGHEYVHPTSLRQFPTDESDPGLDLDLNNFLIATEFTLSNGQVLFGYCSAWDSSGLDYLQPVIILEKKHVRLFPTAGASREAIAVALGLTSDLVFPITAKTMVTSVDLKICHFEIT